MSRTAAAWPLFALCLLFGYVLGRWHLARELLPLLRELQRAVGTR